MPPARKLSPQSVWDSSAVLQAFQEEGIKPVHAVRMWGHLIRHSESSWHDVPDMPKAALALLDQYFAKFTTRVVKCQTSSDSTTTKLLVELQDGMQVEAVVMTYEAPSRDPQLSLLPGPGGAGSSRSSSRRRHEVDPYLPVDHRPQPGEEEEQEEEEQLRKQQPQQQQQREPQQQRQQQQQQRRQQQQQQFDRGGPEQLGQEQLEQLGYQEQKPHGDVEGDEGGQGRGACEGEEGPCCEWLADREGGECSPFGGGAGGNGGGVVIEASSSESTGLTALASGMPAAAEVVVAAATTSRLRRRSTLCVSSQVGCQMGCTFCATGTMGLKGHLNAGEIVEQLIHARAVARIRNIVFMGMGEPLNNYEAVRSAVALMTDSRFFGLRRRHVTVSTVGVIPRIKQLAQDLPGVSLALSLHAPTQELRAKIVPSARAYKLPALMEAVRAYQANSCQRVFYEYVMLAGLNDGLEHAHQLGQLLQGDDVVINLIPWNPIYQPEGPFFEAPREGSVAAFQGVLRHTYGLHTTIRQEMGQDISGACGQLVIESGGAGGSGACSREAGGLPRDIEDAVRKVRLGPVA